MKVISRIDQHYIPFLCTWVFSECNTNWRRNAADH